MASKEVPSTAAMPPVSSEPTINRTVDLAPGDNDGLTIPILEKLLLSVAIGSSVEAILILSSNIVLLLLIITSPSMRKQTRYKLVLSIVCGNIAVGIFGPPFLADVGIRGGWLHNCLVTIIGTLLHRFIASFVEMWGMVLLLLHYMAGVLKYEGPEWMVRLPSWLLKALPGLIVASPWMIGVLVLAPLISLGLHRFTLMFWGVERCPFILMPWVDYTFVTVCYFIPAVVITVLVITICLRLKDSARAGRDRLHGAEMGAALVLAGKEEEEVKSGRVHVVAAVALVLMTGPENVFQGFQMVRIGSLDLRASFILTVIISLMADLTPFVLAMLWLLKLPEIKAWGMEVAARLLCCTAWLRRKGLLTQGTAATSAAPVSFRQLRDDE